MQTSAHNRRGQAASNALPYFQLPEAGRPFFRLAVFFNALAELRAFDALTSDVYSNGEVTTAEAMALAGAGGYFRLEVRRPAGEVVREGLLPFAWTGTQVLAEFEKVAA